MKRPVPVESASRLIDEKIKELGDWRGKTLAKVRENHTRGRPFFLLDCRPGFCFGSSEPVETHKSAGLRKAR